MSDNLDQMPTMKPRQNFPTGDDFDSMPTMKPNHSVVGRDDLDTQVTMRPQTSSSVSDELKRGDVLDGKYHVIKKLGQGGMGAVYKVIDDLDVEYAVKVVLPEYIADTVALKELRVELAKAQKFTHQNLLNYKFFGDTGSIKYIVMELIDGENLEEYRLRKGGKITEDDVRRIAMQILNGLNYFHEKGLVHLDLKPQNIMVSRDGEVKITDYGISTSIKEQIEANAKSGEMSGGTLCFMAPEQLNGSFCDCRTDIYALGLIFYQLLKGELPFSLESKEAIVVWHLDAKHACPKTGFSTFDRIIARAVSFDPKQRFTNCVEIVELLSKPASPSAPEQLPEPDISIFEAIKAGDLDAVRWWLKEVPAVVKTNNASTENRPLLHFAVIHCPRPEIVEILARAKAKINEQDSEFCMPIHLAVMNKGMIEPLIKFGADVNGKTNYGKTPLLMAVERNNMEIAACLIDAGANVNEKNSLGRPVPLIVTAIKNGNKKMLDYLIGRGAAVNECDVDNRTPLFDAIRENSNLEIIKSLVSAGADVNHRASTKFGAGWDEVQIMTPLHEAAQCDCNVEILKYLISRGAKVDAAGTKLTRKDGKRKYVNVRPLDVANTNEKERILRESDPRQIKQYQQLEEEYKSVQKSPSEKGWQGLATAFRAMKGYKNTTELAEQCEKQLQALQYQRLGEQVKMVQKSLSEEGWQSLSIAFRQMNGYKNTTELAEQCEKQFQALKKRREAEDQKRRDAKERALIERANWKSQGLCMHCGGEMGGLFTKTCKSCGKPK